MTTSTGDSATKEVIARKKIRKIEGWMEGWKDRDPRKLSP